jgi:hypothetical protein
MKMKPLWEIAMVRRAFCITGLFHFSMAFAAEAQKPIILKTMGSLFFGGTVASGPDCEIFHGDQR